MDLNQIVEHARNFADQFVKPYFLGWDRLGAFPDSLFHEMGNASLLGFFAPAEYGGLNTNYKDFTAAIIEISKICGTAGLNIAVNNSLCSRHILKFGSAEQKRKYLPDLVKGDMVGAWALTEPNAGSDSGSMQCTAVRTGNSWTFNGEKIFITNGKRANVLVLIAKTGPERNNVSAFIIEKGTKGFTTSEPMLKLGMKASETVRLKFDNCIIPESNLLGNLNEGFYQAMQMLDGGRISISALAIGIATGSYEIALKYATQRKQFGKSIMSNQAISFKLAEIKTKLFAAEQMLAGVCQNMDDGLNVTAQCAMVKLFASEMAVQVTNDSLQILGGYGYLAENIVEKNYRDAKICTIGEGTSEILKMVIARDLIKNIK